MTPLLSDLQAMSEEEFREAFRRSPLKRPQV